MATELKEKAKEAFVDDNFELAVELYTQALDLDPRSADLFADRAQANLKLNNFTGNAFASCWSDPSALKVPLFVSVLGFPSRSRFLPFLPSLGFACLPPSPWLFVV